MYIPLRKAAQELGLHPNTLRKYADNGTIPSIKNAAGQRLFDVQCYIRGAIPAAIICYCRVSFPKQRDDLERQVAYMQERYPAAEIIRDIASGINFKRKGLRALLDRLLAGDKLTLVVAHKDRLARFGFDLVRYLVEQNGGELVVLDQAIHSPAAELTQDLLSILTVFSCRMHELRKYRHQIKEDPLLADSGATPDP
jgi:predicted site-specific integrase-resolvase